MPAPPPSPSNDDPLAFPPPLPTTSTRHDGWTAARQRAFIAALAQHGGVSAAARSVGMTLHTANWLRRHPHGQWEH